MRAVTNHWRLAWRGLQREWRSSEVRVLLLALMIGVGSISTTGFLGDRMDRALVEKGGEFLGADVLISSSEKLSDELVENDALTRSTALDFSSMLATQEAFQLASIRAVDSAYPLRGEVRVSFSLADEGVVRHAMPEKGEVFVDPQLLPLLNVALGDVVEIGVTEFKITGLVKDEPGRAGAVFGLAPRVFMRMDEVEKTEILQPGSRVAWLHYFAGRDEDVRQFIENTKPKLLKTERLVGGKDGSEAVSGAFARTERFGNLASLVSLLLAAVAIALAARRYAFRHFDQAALMRCFGMQSHGLRIHYVTQVLLIGVLGSLLGLAVGYFAHSLLLQVFVPQLAERLPSVGFRPVIAGMGSGLLALLGAALPSLLKLIRVPPLRVLRRDVMPLPASAKLIGAVSFVIFIALCYWYAGSLRLVASFLAGIGVFALLLWLLAMLTLQSSKILRMFAPGALRFGIAQLLRHRFTASVQLGAFALALMLMGVVSLVRTDLIDAWRQQLPEDAPNHFLVNIAEENVPQIESFVRSRSHQITELYPMVRGRLVGKNGKTFDEVLDEQSKQDNSLRRELNLTFTSQLPANNKVTEGIWHGESELAEISVEKKLAQRINLSLGDEVLFRIADRDVKAKVSSLREVKWDSMQPNFFIIFSKNGLNQFPASYIAAMKIPADDHETVASFVKTFPTVTVIALEKVIAEVQSVIGQVVLAVELLLGFLLLAGVAVLAAALLSSLDERRHEAIVLRTLGAQKSFICRSLVSEFVLVGLMAGVLAAAGTEAVSLLISSQVFDLEEKYHPWLWLVCPLAGVLIVTLSGLWSTRHITKVAPMIALRESL